VQKFSGKLHRIEEFARCACTISCASLQQSFSVHDTGTSDQQRKKKLMVSLLEIFYAKVASDDTGLQGLAQ